jgi:hypothetical protein
MVALQYEVDLNQRLWIDFRIPVNSPYSIVTGSVVLTKKK